MDIGEGERVTVITQRMGQLFVWVSGHTGGGKSNCDHTEDTSVVCVGKWTLRMGKE